MQDGPRIGQEFLFDTHVSTTSPYLSESRGVLCDPGDPGHGDEDGRLIGHVLHPDEDGGRGCVDLAEIGRPVASQDLQVVARFLLVVEVLGGMSSMSRFNHG